MTVSVKQPPKLKRRAQTSSSKPKQRPKQLGDLGEKRAASFLTTLGFTLIDHNVSIGGGEIDLIAWDPHTAEVIFVEVKTRHQRFSGDPSFAVDHRKLRALLRASRAYMASWRRTHHASSFRIDLVTVLPGKLAHYPNISWELLQ